MNHLAFETTEMYSEVLVLLPLLVPGLLASPCKSLCRCLDNGEVYCNRTGISEVPRGLPVNLTLLDLSDNPIHRIPRNAFLSLNSMTSLVINGNGFTTGDIEAGALNLPLLTDIDLSFNSYRSISRYLPRGMTTFRLIQNKLETLFADSFVNYTSIVYLDLSNNQLKTIQPHVFDPLGNLDTLYIPFNNLTDQSYPQNVFSKNVKLTILSLRFNQMKNMLKNLPVSLQHLDYVGNQIKVLPAYALQNLTQLQTLEMWEGQVSIIEDNAFYGLAQLSILDFMQDKIQSNFTKDTFNGLTGLGTIYLSINNISHIDPQAFRSFGSLTQLWMDGNKLTSLQPEVLDSKYMPHLSMLFIDFNPWYCDCHLRWLREKMDDAPNLIQDPHLVKCAGPARVAGKAWDELKSTDFVCT